MSAYNDYMIKVVTYFISLSEHYCNLLIQGIDDCCIRNKMNLLGMYIDIIPRVGNENCLTTEETTAISEHINTLCGYPNWGTLTNINPVIIPTSATSVTSTIVAAPQGWNTTIGTAWTVITFSEPLGNSGTSWGMTYTAVNSSLETVFLEFTNRTANGFTVRALEENVAFEGSAVLKTT